MTKPFSIRSLALSALAAGSILLTPLSAYAADVIVDPIYDYRDEVGKGEFQYDDSQDIPWIENETEVLAIPKPEDLSEVKLDEMPEGFTLFIDKSRITVNENDDVIRVWLWIRSQSGSESGTFEGYRCATGENKVYAYANPQRDPPVTKAKRPRWQRIAANRNGNYRFELLHDYFCGIRGTRTASEISDYLSGEFRREYFMSQ